MRPSRTSDPLRAFLWGKRAAIRHPLALDVVVNGAQGATRAVSLDVSASGVLLRFPVEALTPRGAAAEVDPFVIAETHFRGTPVARFRRRRVKVHLELVRLDYRQDDPDHLYVGFRFARPLASRQLQKLGLDPSRCGSEAHGLPSQMVELRAAGDPPTCCLRDGDTVLFEGHALGLGKQSLCVRLDTADLADVAGRLSNRTATLDVFEGDAPLWSGGAKLQSIGLLDDAPDALELGLVLDERPGAELKRRFRPHWAA